MKLELTPQTIQYLVSVLVKQPYGESVASIKELEAGVAAHNTAEQAKQRDIAGQLAKLKEYAETLPES